MPPIYIISLHDAYERRRAISAQMSALGLDYRFVDAFDGRELVVEEHANYDPDITDTFLGRHLSGGEIGCYESHVSVAKELATSSYEMALVLEDDAIMTKDAAHTLVRIAERLRQSKQAWDIVNLAPAALKYSSVIAKFGAYHLYRAHYFPTLTTALLWSKSGATAFLNDHSAIGLPIDEYFRIRFTQNNRGLAVLPPLFPPSGAESDIDLGASFGRRQKLSFWRKQVSRTPLRIRAIRSKINGVFDNFAL